MGLKRDLARGSKAVSVITLLGHFISTGLKLLVSRNFGLLGFGQFALYMAFSRFFSTIIQLGYHQSIVHFISKYRTKQDWLNVRHFYMSGVMHILLFSLLMTILLFFFGDILFKYIDLEGSVTYALLYISAISILIAINNFISATLVSLKLFKAQAFLFSSALSGLMILAILGLKFFQVAAPTFDQFLFVAILLNVILLAVAFFLTLMKFEKPMNPDAEKEDIKQLPKYSLPILYSSTLQTAATSSDRIMLGIFSSISEVGIYGAGLTFSILFAFPLRSMGPIFQPFIIECYSNHDYKGINKLYNIMVRWSSLFVIPTFSALLCFGDQLIQLFGRDFSDAYAAMIILSLAQMISTISGIAGTMLNMTDKQRPHAKIMVIGFVTAITLNLLLIPPFGAVGAAVGTGISILITNLFRVHKLAKYYSLKTDYSIVFWLFLKFTPLVIITFWLTGKGYFHWSIIFAGFTAFSLALVYHSLTNNELKYFRTFLRNKTPNTKLRLPE